MVSGLAQGCPDDIRSHLLRCEIGFKVQFNGVSEQTGFDNCLCIGQDPGEHAEVKLDVQRYSDDGRDEFAGVGQQHRLGHVSVEQKAIFVDFIF